MGALIPFTSNYSDVSTYDGYQFEFRCQRCGNGYRSQFRHSVMGFGGRIAALGGGLLGGEIGSKVQEVGLLAQWDRSGTRGSTNDKRLVEASQDVAGEFAQCRGCAEWVCRGVCWDDAAGCCVRCVPEQQVDGGAQAQAPYGPPQRYESPQGQGYAPQGYGPPHGRPPGYGQPQGYVGPQAGGQPQAYSGPQTGGQPQAYRQPPVSLRHPGRHPAPAGAQCLTCGSSVQGRFCGSCGAPAAPPPCSGCGAPLQGSAFCTSCGTPAS